MTMWCDLPELGQDHKLPEYSTGSSMHRRKGSHCRRDIDIEAHIVQLRAKGRSRYSCPNGKAILTARMKRQNKLTLRQFSISWFPYLK